jgi:hypothetical protein
MLDAPGQRQRVEIVEAAVGIDVDLHPGSHRSAYGLKALHIFSDHISQRAGFIAPLQTMVTYRHLQALEAAFDPAGCSGRQFVAFKECEAERGVDRNLRARTTEQLPARLAEDLALQVPKCQVNGCDRVAGIA